jgi:hypothetical protein
MRDEVRRSITGEAAVMPDGTGHGEPLRRRRRLLRGGLPLKLTALPALA